VQQAYSPGNGNRQRGYAHSETISFWVDKSALTGSQGGIKSSMVGKGLGIGGETSGMANLKK
jgi:hypothetical protein